jgi:hypothetical protein
MFDPFGKPMKELTIDDLQVLKIRNIAEGLYIEYKSDFPNPAKVSHSLASFANSYGGWYIIGITDDVNNVPQNFNGFSLQDHQNPKEKIRDIVRDHINPLIRFASHLIELENRKAILVVQVDESDDTPHVTKDGRIYRRNGEGSDPIAETDRLAIDRLYDRGKNFQRRIKQFCINDMTISRGEENQGWVEIYLMTCPFDKFIEHDFFRESHISEVKQMLETATPINLGTGTDNYIASGIPMGNVYPALNSLTFRQITQETLPFSVYGATYRLYRNGNCKIIIPFSYINSETFQTVYGDKPVGNALISHINIQDFPLFKIIDGFQLLTAFVVLLAKHIEYLNRKGWRDEILSVFKFQNTWRNILFLDSDAFKSQVERYGVPTCLQNSGSFPQNIENKYPLKSTTSLVSLVVEFVWLAQHLGIFQETITGSTDDWFNYLRSIEQSQSQQQ